MTPQEQIRKLVADTCHHLGYGQDAPAVEVAIIEACTMWVEEIAKEFDRRAARDKALANSQAGVVGFGVTASFAACWHEAAQVARESAVRLRELGVKE